MPNTDLRNILSVDQLSKFFSKLDIHVVSNGYCSIKDEKDLEVDWGSYYRVNYIIEGNVELHCCNIVRLFTPGMVLIMPPERLTKIAEGSEVKLFYINFQMRNLSYHEDFDQFINDNFPDFCVKDRNKEILKLFEISFQEGHDHPEGSYFLNHILLYSILISMTRFAMLDKPRISHSSDDLNQQDDYYNTALRYIQEHIEDKIEITDLADYLGISEIYLYKIFKKHTGESPQQFIIRYRIHQSTHYLANPNIPIKKIADMLGFSSASHYSVIFKKYMNETPAAFRKRTMNA
ncbi:MAG: helix-turn-helix transcriptional regulator [Erysipelotrichaceae bacterium]|nr:helix-turn-helix transcriptional regulator [Erysipelotrichaceae bacterium]